MKKNVDISIVGCGPVGATLANLLADYNYEVAVIEKETEIYRAPRAVHLDDEVLRIFQAIDILKDLEKSITPFRSMQFVSGSGKVLLETGMPADCKSYGHEPSNWFFQPHLEEILRDRFKQFSHLHYYEGYEVKAIKEDDESTTLEATNHQNNDELKITSKYLIGCDGSKSMVRKTMGVRYESLDFDQPWMVVDTFLKSEKDAALLPAIHQQICNPKRPTTYVPGVGKHRRFEFMLMEGETEESISHPTAIRDLIASHIDVDKLTIARSAVYTFHGLTVDRWRKGRLLLAGDSAHQMPPFAGQGMCSGIRDAHNLAFKLDLLLSGKTSESILETYQMERKPHVAAISRGAIKMGKLIQTQNPVVGWMRNFQFFLARHSTFIQEKIRDGIIKKIPYKKGLIGKNHLSGKLAIQPTVQKYNGQNCLLDEILGNQFALIIKGKIGENEIANFRQFTNGHTFLLGKDFSSAELSDWMEDNKIDFVIIRPDRYVFDAGKTQELNITLRRLYQGLTQNFNK